MEPLQKRPQGNSVVGLVGPLNVCRYAMRTIDKVCASCAAHLFSVLQAFGEVLLLLLLLQSSIVESGEQNVYSERKNYNDCYSETILQHL